MAYHTKDGCFKKDRIDELCTLGQHVNLIIPPHWVIKLNKKVIAFVAIKKIDKHNRRLFSL